MLRYLIQSIFILLVVGNAHADTQAQRLVSASNDFNNKNYTSALAQLKQLEHEEVVSSHLFYNLGSVYLKIDSIAQAVYYLERAHKIAPADAAIAAQLALAYDATIDKMQPMPELFFIRWYKQLCMRYSSSTWAIASILFAWICLLIIIIHLRKSIVTSYYNRIAFVLALLFFIITFLFANSRLKFEKNKQEAIVFPNKTIGRTQAFANADEAFVVHEGCKVQIVKPDIEFTLVRLSDGREGWISNATYRVF